MSEQALLSLLVLGPPRRSLTLWATVVAEREASWLFSLPFRAAHLSAELFSALYGLAVDPETPKSVRLKIRGLFYVYARAEPAPPGASKYWKRLEQTPPP